MGELHRPQCLQWTHEHRNLIIEVLTTIACFDESRFLVYHIDWRVEIHLFLTETLAPGCTGGHRQACNSYIITRSMFLWSTLEPLSHFRTITDIRATPDAYIHKKLLQTRYSCYQQENAQCHTGLILRVSSRKILVIFKSYPILYIQLKWIEHNICGFI